MKPDVRPTISGVHQHQHWDQFCITLSLITWMMEESTVSKLTGHIKLEEVADT